MFESKLGGSSFGGTRTPDDWCKFKDSEQPLGIRKHDIKIPNIKLKSRQKKIIQNTNFLSACSVINNQVKFCIPGTDRRESLVCHLVVSCKAINKGNHVVIHTKEDDKR
jgi:hypothetical protein